MSEEMMKTMNELLIDLNLFTIVATGECSTNVESPRKDVGH